MLRPVIRLVDRSLLPSTSSAMISARSVRLSLFMLTEMLEDHLGPPHRIAGHLLLLQLLSMRERG